MQEPGPWCPALGFKRPGRPWEGPAAIPPHGRPRQLRVGRIEPVGTRHNVVRPPRRKRDRAGDRMADHGGGGAAGKPTAPPGKFWMIIPVDGLEHTRLSAVKVRPTEAI